MSITFEPRKRLEDAKSPRVSTHMGPRPPLLSRATRSPRRRTDRRRQSRDIMSTSLMQEQSDQQQHLMEQSQNQLHTEMDQELSIEPKGSFAELVVKAAVVCNRVLVENCSICTMYCDKQVQYETAVMERYVTGAALSDLFRTLDANPEVQEYRERLFDEQSVVESVNSRLDE